MQLSDPQAQQALSDLVAKRFSSMDFPGIPTDVDLGVMALDIAGEQAFWFFATAGPSKFAGSYLFSMIVSLATPQATGPTILAETTLGATSDNVGYGEDLRLVVACAASTGRSGLLLQKHRHVLIPGKADTVSLRGGAIRDVPYAAVDGTRSWIRVISAARGYQVNINERIAEVIGIVMSHLFALRAAKHGL